METLLLICLTTELNYKTTLQSSNVRNKTIHYSIFRLLLEEIEFGAVSS
jgi:hypothetical protein